MVKGTTIYIQDVTKETNCAKNGGSKKTGPENVLTSRHMSASLCVVNKL